MNPAQLEDLASSIASQVYAGLCGSAPVFDNQYEIIAGERRWRLPELG